MTSENPTERSILEKFQELTTAWNEALEGIAALQLRKKEIDSQLQDCIAAARLFGVSLPDAPDLISIDNHIEDGQLDAGSLPAQSTVKKKIESLLMAAYPEPLWSRTIREKIGGEVHEKTVGMTLNRLDKEGIVRRDGRDWYYVPEQERLGTRIPTTKGHRFGRVWMGGGNGQRLTLNAVGTDPAVKEDDVSPVPTVKEDGVSSDPATEGKR